MAKALLDVPATPSKPSTAVGPSADDLLAQMAGDEIDRMLADADAPRPSEPAPVTQHQPSAAGSPAETAINGLEKQLDDLFEQLGGSDKPAAAAQQPAEPRPTSPVAPAEDAVAAATPPVVVSSPSGPDQPQTSPPAAAPAQASAPPPAEEASSAQERQALVQSPAPSAEAAAGAAAPSAPAAAEVAAEGEDEPLPWYLRPLEWISAPAQGWSDRARQLVGKIAILTAANAVAILIYVLLFRKGQ
jgi:hypothetical protein